MFLVSATLSQQYEDKQWKKKGKDVAHILDLPCNLASEPRGRRKVPLTRLVSSSVGDAVPSGVPPGLLVLRRLFHDVPFDPSKGDKGCRLARHTARQRPGGRLVARGCLPRRHAGGNGSAHGVQYDQQALPTVAEVAQKLLYQEATWAEGHPTRAPALRRLSTSDRDLIRAVIDGVPRDLLTGELGISPEALRQRLRRARVAFQKALEGGGSPLGPE